MISRVELEHWRAHHHSVFEFSKGTNVLVGVMGSGKTSLADAICYALFGTFPALNSKKVSLQEVIMQKPTQEDFATIKLDFSHQGKQYSIERTMFRDSRASQAKLYENNQLKVGPKPQQVTEEVEKLLELDYELFSRAVYSEQNQIDYFIKLSPRERKEKLDELLSLDKYERARGKGVQVVNQIKKGNEERKRITSELRQKFDPKSFEQAEQSLARKNLEQIGSEKKRNETQSLMEAQRKEFNSLEEKRQRFQKTREQSLQAKALMESAEKEWKSLETFSALAESESKAIEKKKNALETIQSLERSLETEREKSRKIKSLEEKRTFLQEQLDGKRKRLLDDSEKDLLNREKLIQTQFDQLGKELQLAELKANQSSQSLAVLEQRKKELDESAKEAAQLSALCPVCQRQINDILKKALVEEKQKKSEETKRAIDGSRALEKQLLEEKRAVTLKQKKALEEIQSVIPQKLLWKEIESVQNQWKTAEENLRSEQSGWSGKKKESIETQLAEEKKSLDSLEKSVRFHERKNVWKKWSEEKNALEKEVQSIGFDENRLKQIGDRLQAISSEFAALQQAISGNAELLVQLEQHAKTLRNAKEQLDSLEKSAERTEQTAEKLTLFLNALERTQGQLREEMVKSINQAMQQVWPRVYPYKDLESAQLKVVEGNYEVLVKERSGRWVRVEGILSGGERSAAAITIRIAISLVLTQQLSWLILDEPTHNLDARAVEELSKMVRDHLPELVDQVFIITHDKEMEKAASAKLYVLQRDKDTDGVTVPVQKALH